MSWFVTDGTTKWGPLSKEEVIEQLKGAHDLEDYFVWQEGWEDWRPLNDSEFAYVSKDTKKNTPTQTPKRSEKDKPAQKPTVQKKDSKESSGGVWKFVLFLVICFFMFSVLQSEKSTQKTQQVASEKPVQKPFKVTQQKPTKQKPSIEEQCRTFGAMVAAQHYFRGSGMSYEDVMEKIASEGFSEDLTSDWEKATAIAYGTEVYYAPARASIRNQAEAECVEAMSKK